MRERTMTSAAPWALRRAVIRRFHEHLERRDFAALTDLYAVPLAGGTWARPEVRVFEERISARYGPG